MCVFSINGLRVIQVGIVSPSGENHTKAPNCKQIHSRMLKLIVNVVFAINVTMKDSTASETSTTEM